MAPESKAPSWATINREVRGIIPVRWLVTKDVKVSISDDLAYHGQPVTQLRHANTIPGLIGQVTVRRFFETPHTYSPVLSPITPGFEARGVDVDQLHRIQRSYGSQFQAPRAPFAYQRCIRPHIRQDRYPPFTGYFPRIAAPSHQFNRHPTHPMDSRNAACCYF